MSITTRRETIGPEKAAQYLKANKTNRPIRNSTVESYALDMSKGHWMFNHQGIAFDEDGNMIDGQHRLSAVIASGAKIETLVTRGIPRLINNGVEIFSMDTVDRGKARTIGDQLGLRHGVKNAVAAAACCAAIATLCSSNKGRFFKLTTPTAIGILDIYSKEIECAVENRGDTHGICNAAVMGSIAFAMKCEPQKVREFLDLLVSGAGLFKTGHTAAVYALRKSLLSNIGKNSGTKRIIVMGQVLNAIKHFCNGDEISTIRATSAGIEYFSNRQKSNVAKVAEMIGG